MSSEYTRRSHLLNSSLQVGRYQASRSEEAYASKIPSPGIASRFLSSRFTEADTSNNDDFKNYESLLRRIRAEQAESLNTSSSSSSGASSSYSLPSRSPVGDGGVPFFHSKHQELMKSRRLLEAATNGTNSNQDAGVGTAAGGEIDPLQFQACPYSTNDGISRPTYSVRNIPVRSLEEVRETIAIRRQYYRERLLGKDDDENSEQESQATTATTGPSSENAEFAEGKMVPPEEALQKHDDESDSENQNPMTDTDRDMVAEVMTSTGDGKTEENENDTISAQDQEEIQDCDTNKAMSNGESQFSQECHDSMVEQQDGGTNDNQNQENPTPSVADDDSSGSANIICGEADAEATTTSVSPSEVQEQAQPEQQIENTSMTPEPVQRSEVENTSEPKNLSNDKLETNPRTNEEATLVMEQKEGNGADASPHDCTSISNETHQTPSEKCVTENSPSEPEENQNETPNRNTNTDAVDEESVHSAE